MELQWPLILFTTFISWCAGTFATQAYLGLKGKGAKIQFECWIVSAALLIIGGIAVFLHLEHWDRIFNGFGHLTSGITQELIAIVILAVIAVVYLVMVKREEGKVPAWVAIAAIVMCVVLVVVMGHSYMMASRPAWNNVLWIVSLLGACCIMGPATVAAVALFKNDEETATELTQLIFIGAIINAVASVLGLVAAAMAQVVSVGYYFDLTHPMKDITIDATNVLGGSSMLLTLVGVVIIGCAGPIVAALMGKKSGNWKLFAPVAVACAVVGAICLRAVFYVTGVSVFGIF